VVEAVLIDDRGERFSLRASTGSAASAARVGDSWPLSAGKEMLPGAKQVVRAHDTGGTMTGDRVVPAGAGEPAGGLLRPVMRAGRILGREDLAAARERCLDQLARLPAPLRALEVAGEPYPVTFDPAFRELLERAKERTGALARHAPAR
jgi:hypothetical protein